MLPNEQIKLADMADMIDCRAIVVQWSGDRLLIGFNVNPHSTETIKELGIEVCLQLRKRQREYQEQIEKRYPQRAVDSFCGITLDQSNNAKQLYIVYVADCAFPPLFLIAAEDESEAIDIAVNEHPALQVNAEDYGTQSEFEDAVENGIVGYADGGKYFDQEQMQCAKCTLFELILSQV